MTTVKATTLWVLQVLLAALFSIQGVLKLGGSPAWIARFRAWGYPEHFYLVVGLIELCGAIALLIPRAAKFGALLLMAAMAAAALTHTVHREPQWVTTLVLFVLLAIIVYARWTRKPDRA